MQCVAVCSMSCIGIIFLSNCPTVLLSSVQVFVCVLHSVAVCCSVLDELHWNHISLKLSHGATVISPGLGACVLDVCRRFVHLCHDSLICSPCLSHMCAMTHSCVHHDPFICATWLVRNLDVCRRFVHLCHDSLIVRHASIMCASCLIHVCAVPRSYVRHDAFEILTFVVPVSIFAG